MEVYQGEMPATSIIMQRPLLNEIAVEIWAIKGDVSLADNISIVETWGGRWAFVGGVEDDDFSGSIFEEIQVLLNREGFRFNDLIRTWFYIGDIISRYELLNNLRNRFYDSIWNGSHSYPASTGIGMSGKGIIMEGIALRPAYGVKVIRLENPLQKSAFQYDMPLNKRPKFCRGVFVGDERKGLIFVSGTASIRDDKVIYPESVLKQTQVTIENISMLMDKKNLGKYGIKKAVSLKDVCLIRVYVKDESYYDLVKEVCNQYFGNIPQTYLLADICRSNLLVEIEALVLMD